MPPGPPIPAEIAKVKRESIRTRRTFGPADLAALLELLGDAREVITLADATSRPPAERSGLIALRHDVDHDLDNAVRLGAIEQEHGYRATYFLLHTDWYYRAQQGVGPPSIDLIEAAGELVAMGHEVALHTNVITQALQTGEPPAQILRRELGYLRAEGFPVKGTVAHGDPLCHTLRYVNYEVFEGCYTPRVGGPPGRTIVFDDWDHGVRREVALTPEPMENFGLEYEANFIGHDIYLSDSGGRWHVEPEAVRQRFVQGGGLLQILMHPVWWALEGEPFTPRTDPVQVGIPR